MMPFPSRAPSTAWEIVPLPTNPSVALWVWFQPGHAPDSVVFQLPPELWQTNPAMSQVSLRLLAGAAGIDSLRGWSLYGQSYPLDAQTVRLLDAALPPPPPGVDPQVVLWAQPSMAQPMFPQPMLPQPMPHQSMTAPASNPETIIGIGELMPGENPGPYFDLINSCWTNIQYIESDVRRARAQLEQSASRLSSLNRDLTFDELQASDSVDRQNWQDARRSLRDAAGGLSRSIKEIDVGLLSSAGQRNKFLDLMERYVKPRVPFPGLKQAALEFEAHHKSAKNVLQAAQTAINKGGTESERRANSILQRIRQKGRQKSNQTRGKNA